MTSYGGVASYSSGRSRRHPQSGQFRRGQGVAGRSGDDASDPSSVPSRAALRVTARNTRNPHPSGTAIATSESTASTIPDMPPWMLDHVAACTKHPAAILVTVPTTTPPQWREQIVPYRYCQSVWAWQHVALLRRPHMRMTHQIPRFGGTAVPQGVRLPTRWTIGRHTPITDASEVCPQPATAPPAGTACEERGAGRSPVDHAHSSRRRSPRAPARS